MLLKLQLLLVYPHYGQKIFRSRLVRRRVEQRTRCVRWDLGSRETNVARSHILGGERMAEQRLVGEVASGHTEPVPDVRLGDVDSR
jgi:hypothetical protein